MLGLMLAGGGLGLMLGETFQQWPAPGLFALGVLFLFLGAAAAADSLERDEDDGHDH